MSQRSAIESLCDPDDESPEMDYKEAERRNSFPDIEEDVFIPGHLAEEDMLDLKKQELTCISEEGIADMGLPDNLLAELEILENITSCNKVSTGCPVCLVLKQGAVNQLFLEVFLMFLACLDHKWWAQFHLGILGPQE